MVKVVKRTGLSGNKDEVSRKEREEVSVRIKDVLTSALVLIVEDPSEVSVDIEHGVNTTIFRINCSQKNIARILGSKGRGIDGLRAVAVAMAGRHGFRCIIEVPMYY